MRFYIYLIYISYLSFVKGNNAKYFVFGVGIFHPLAAADSCIRSYHREPEGIPLTALLIAENKVMKKVRVLIEHTYASIDAHYKKHQC